MVNCSHLRLRNGETNEVKVTGFCIDVFEQIRSYSSIFLSKNGKNSTEYNYNDLIEQVFIKKFDAVVADLTITAKRSQQNEQSLSIHEKEVGERRAKVEEMEKAYMQGKTGDELLLQEGHIRSVYGLSFHHDGSLAASCGLDALACVWDLRSGRSILALEVHVKLVWSCKDFKPVRTLSGHESKITSLDVVADGQYTATVSHDRTIKLWSSKDAKKEKAMDVD
ncbi:hypothetical protein C2S51_037315 [Perilla frutescens var. frutescens]|nr:hypothetical protein C2S51_037315 [Perilla frutescens var. frutescens]